MKLAILAVLVLIVIFSSGCLEQKENYFYHGCNKDSDCAIKVVGCSCAGEERACVNKDSESVNCRSDFDFFQKKCMVTQTVPTYCMCENNACQAIFATQ